MYYNNNNDNNNNNNKKNKNHNMFDTFVTIIFGVKWRILLAKPKDFILVAVGIQNTSLNGVLHTREFHIINNFHIPSMFLHQILSVTDSTEVSPKKVLLQSSPAFPRRTVMFDVEPINVQALFIKRALRILGKTGTVFATPLAASWNQTLTNWRCSSWSRKLMAVVTKVKMNGVHMTTCNGPGQVSSISVRIGLFLKYQIIQLWPNICLPPSHKTTPSFVDPAISPLSVPQRHGVESVGHGAGGRELREMLRAAGSVRPKPWTDVLFLGKNWGKLLRWTF